MPTSLRPAFSRTVLSRRGSVPRADVRPPLVSRLGTPFWVAVDSLFAALLAALSFAGAIAADVPWPVIGLAVATALPIAVRRLWPVPVFLAVLVASVTLATIRADTVTDIEITLVLYTVAARLGHRRSLVALVAALAATTVWTAASADRGSMALLVWAAGAAYPLTAWALGVTMYQHRRYNAARQERTASEATMRERLRVARELHDVLAHGMSLIAVQASVANHVVDKHPDEARRVLASIAETSRAGLAELRRLLATLRTDEAGHDEEPAAGLRPAPGLGDLDPLLAGVREAGVRPAVEVRGTQRPLPPGIDLCGYRIVQEALTNVIKHAGPVVCRITLDYQADAVAIEVADDGTGPRADAGGGDSGDDGSGDDGSGDDGSGAGHGIRGMRERVAMYGGELTAAPIRPPGSGFRVYARLPLGASKRAATTPAVEAPPAATDKPTAAVEAPPAAAERPVAGAPAGAEPVDEVAR